MINKDLEKKQKLYKRLKKWVYVVVWKDQPKQKYFGIGYRTRQEAQKFIDEFVLYPEMVYIHKTPFNKLEHEFYDR